MRVEVEIAVACLVAVVAFALAAAVSAAARSHIPAVVFGAVLVLYVAAIAQYAGMVYAIPVGAVSIEAYDWYFLPPLRALDGATILVLAIVIVTAVLIAELAERAVRRASASEAVWGVLADELEALRRVATLVARQSSAEEVFATVAEEVGKLLQLDTAQMYRYESGTLTVVAAWGVDGPAIPVGTELVLDGDSVAIRALRTRRPSRIDDYSLPKGATADYVRSLGMRSAIGTPIIVEGQIWGLLTAASLHTDPLAPEAELRIEKFAELIATAISNAEAKRTLERMASEQAVLGRVATLVAEAAPSNEIFSAVAEEIIRLFDVPTVGLFRYGPGRTATVVGGAGDMAAYVGRAISVSPHDLGVLASVLRTGHAGRVDDYTGLEGGGPDFAREVGIGSGMGTPLIVDGRIWGCVMLGLPRGVPPLPLDTADRLTAFSDLVATAIANAEARIEIARLADEQAALRRVATLVARGVPPSEVFAAVAEELGRVLGVDGTVVFRYEPDATATMIASWGGHDGGLPTGSNWQLDGNGVITRVFRTGRSARFDGYREASGELGTWARDLGVHSAVGAPIVVDDQLWGIAAAATTTDSLPETAESRIASFAELIATAISNAANRTELTASRARVVAAADETRRRIERDLHDGIQQRLVSLALKVRMAETMAPRPWNEIQGELSLLADDLVAALEALREISRGIHPAILSEGGLEPALKTLARRCPLPVALDVQTDSRLDEALEVTAYYVVSEAFTNAVKHAKASILELAVKSGDDHLALTISDDGVGGADPSRGSGLIGLRDRVEAVGGTISVVSPSGGGTTLHVLIPMAADARSLFEAALGEGVANARSDANAERRPVGRDNLSH
ncbi:MAG TPA: GAF domain-containing protein [Gaiellaceae bacterium]|nr:GAF domain-containing protein [Gaiellaceae bacterium]